MSERDTHFKNSAKLLWNRLMSVHDGWIDVSDAGMDSEDIEEYQQIIAHFAFDLVKHTIYHSPASDYLFEMSDVPDLKEWSG